MLFDCPAAGRAAAPTTLPELERWILVRLREPSATWRRRSPIAALLPTPVNLPGMDRAAAAVVAKYAFMPVEWRADVIQNFMAGWLLRPETPQTLARSALAGLERRNVATIEAGIAWKLRMEILSRAHRELERERRRQERELVLLPAYE